MAVRSEFDEKRLRAISMVMRNLDNYTEGGARADYDAMLADGARLAAIWREARHIQVTSPAGTDLTAPIAGEAVMVECGFATEPGQEAARTEKSLGCPVPEQGLYDWTNRTLDEADWP